MTMDTMDTMDTIEYITDSDDYGVDSDLERSEAPVTEVCTIPCKPQME
jgi:hypothetical protein